MGKRKRIVTLEWMCIRFKAHVQIVHKNLFNRAIIPLEFTKLIFSHREMGEKPLEYLVFKWSLTQFLLLIDDTEPSALSLS